MKRISCCLLVMFFLALSSVAVSAKLAPGDFIDITEHWAEKNIILVSNLGLMTGMGENGEGYKIFAPEEKMSRAQLASIMQRAFELNYDETRFEKEPQASDYYQDVDNQAWYAEAVCLSAVNNVFDTGGYFHPDQTVTRIEVARALYRCVEAKGLNIAVITLMPYYRDMEGLSQEDTNALVFASNTSLMKGDGEYWYPNNEITRAEMARVLHGLIDILALDENADNHEYRLAPGETLTLKLDSNPSTGFSWMASYDEEMLALVGKDYQASASSDLVGAGGQDYWRFKALRPGPTELKMTYSRPWESVQPLHTLTLKVDITAGQAHAEKVNIKTNKVEEKTDLIEVELNIPVISGALDADIKTDLNRLLEDEAMNFKEKLEAEVVEYARECEAQGFSIRSYQVFTDYEVATITDDIISLYVDYYCYTGGAHGSTDRRAYNIDLQSGELLPLAQLFDLEYDYRAVIDQEINRQIALAPENYFEGEFGFTGISEEPKYYLEEENLVIYFAQYEIAPYAAGIPEFKIPFSSI